MSRYRDTALQIAELVEKKQRAYGDSFSKSGRILHILLEKYYNEDTHSYNIPYSLVDRIPYFVRIWDKHSRVFANPDGDLLDESPFLDCLGYDLLAVVNEEACKNRGRVVHRKCKKCGKPAPADARYCSSECAFEDVRTDKPDELRRLSEDESDGSNATH